MVGLRGGLRAKVLGRLGCPSPSKSVCSILPLARHLRAGASYGVPALGLLEACAPPFVFDYPEDLLSVHYQVFFVLKLDLHPRVFAQDHHIPGADLYPVLELADLDDLRRLRFLLGRVGQHYPACVLLFALDHLDQSALAQWLELHIPFSCVGWLTRLKLRVGRRFIKRGGAPSPGWGILRGVPAFMLCCPDGRLR